jgi:hypothetical protein
MGAIVHDFVSRMWPVRLGALLLPAESIARVKDRGPAHNPRYPESFPSFCKYIAGMPWAAHRLLMLFRDLVAL